MWQIHLGALWRSLQLQGCFPHYPWSSVIIKRLCKKLWRLFKISTSGMGLHLSKVLNSLSVFQRATNNAPSLQHPIGACVNAVTALEFASPFSILFYPLTSSTMSFLVLCTAGGCEPFFKLKNKNRLTTLCSLWFIQTKQQTHWPNCFTWRPAEVLWKRFLPGCTYGSTAGESILLRKDGACRMVKAINNYVYQVEHL